MWNGLNKCKSQAHSFGLCQVSFQIKGDTSTLKKYAIKGEKRKEKTAGEMLDNFSKRNLCHAIFECATRTMNEGQLKLTPKFKE